MSALVERLPAFLRRRQAQGDDGKTFLLGIATDGVSFALAAGLDGAADHPGFLRFARYLIHHRFAGVQFALLLPASFDGAAVYVAECHYPGGSTVNLLGGIPDAGGAGGPALAAGLIGDLTVPESALPGVMRREFDRLYEALQLPLQDV